MPSTKSYRQLHERVATRPGAALRLAGLQKRTLLEMKEYKLQQAPCRVSQSELDFRGPVDGS